MNPLNFDVVGAFYAKTIELSVARGVPTLPEEPGAREFAVELLKQMSVNGDLFMVCYTLYKTACENSSAIYRLEGVLGEGTSYLTDGFENLSPGELADLLLAPELLHQEVTTADSEALGDWFYDRLLEHDGIQIQQLDLGPTLEQLLADC